MENIKVLQTPEFLSMHIPVECVPQRFAVATNILLCATLADNNSGLLMFNYEPEKWNQWYPYFSSVNAMYTFTGVTYKDIVYTFEKDIMSRADVQNRIRNAERTFLELLGNPHGKIIMGDSPVVSEMWLKYSKTQNIWTFYYIEFLQVKQLPNVNFGNLDTNVVDFMPLTEETIDEVLKTGQFRGIDVVDNTLDIIRSKETILALKNNAIAL